MPYADNQGVRIHYRVEGEGQPLVLQHGFTGSIEDWSDYGYVASLKHYRLILVDARGHGGSDKPHDVASYALDKRAGDVVAVLDALGIAKAHFWGYSMGGWIGFGMAQYAPERVDRLVIGGAHPYARDQEWFRQQFRLALAQGSDAFLTAFEQAVGPLAPGWRERLRAADFEAYLAAAEDRPNLEAVLPIMAMPCCVYAGEADPLLQRAETAGRLIPRATFFSLPGLTHYQGYLRSDLVVPRVKRFLQGKA